MGRLFLLFAIIPVIEIALLLQVGAVIGGFSTVLLILATAFIGARLVRNQGLETLRQAQTKLEQQQLPTQEIAAGICLLVAGVLLVTPGIMTDIFGFSLLIPQVRQLLGAKMAVFVARNATVRTSHMHAGFNQQHFEQRHFQQGQTTQDTNHRDPNVIEGDYERKN